jgi:CrcB protein
VSWSHAVAVALGGVFGALARYGVYHGMRLYVPAGYPVLATLVVNTLGCAAMGVCTALFATKTPVHFFLTVGFLGSFTTFSAFTADIFLLAQSRPMVEVMGFVMAMMGLGVLAFAVGMKVGRL